MSRLKSLSWILTAGLLTAGVAHGQTSGTSTQTSSTAGTTSSAQQTSMQATTPPTAAPVDVQQLRQTIEQKSAKVAAETRARAESQLEVTSKQVETTVEKGGEANVAQRLGAEFGTSAQALTDERTRLNVSWGQLMIAHTIAANSNTGVTAEQLLECKRDGMGWGTIAAGLGLNLGSVVSGVKAEGQVANGIAKADGRVSRMRGEGARASNVGAQAGMSVGHAHAGAGLGVGVKVGK
jgi:hypothetical protein